MTENTQPGGTQVPPQHSEKLRKAADEINKILVDHDIAGVVQLFEPGFNEYTMHIAPSFSCVSLNDEKQLKINPPIEHPEYPEIRKKKIADTVNMLGNMRLYTGKLSLILTRAEITVRSHFGIKTPKPKPGPPNIVNPNFRKNGRGH